MSYGVRCDQISNLSADDPVGQDDSIAFLFPRSNYSKQHDPCLILYDDCRTSTVDCSRDSPLTTPDSADHRSTGLQLTCFRHPAVRLPLFFVRLCMLPAIVQPPANGRTSVICDTSTWTSQIPTSISFLFQNLEGGKVSHRYDIITMYSRAQPFFLSSRHGTV